MADAPDLIYNDRPGAIPANYRFPPGLDARLSSVSAVFDGTGASGDFLACLSVYSQDNKLVGRFFPGSPVAAGDVAEVTFAPFLRQAQASAAPAAMPWAFMQRDADVAVADGATVLIDTYETTGGNPGSAFSFDAAGGKILINETGQYLASGATRWISSGTSGVPVPSAIRLDWNFDTGYTTSDAVNEYTYDLALAVLVSGVSSPLIITVLVGTPSDYVEMKVKQTSGASRSITRSFLSITKLSDVS